jgi:hypothetical protein
VNQKASLLAAIAFLLILPSSTFAQGVQSETAPVLPAGVLGTDLIAWSQMQTPRPVPQPLPPDQNPRTEQQATAEIFAGTIAKVGASYILKANGGATYRLNEQELGDHDGDQHNAKKYDGKQVRLFGYLDANHNHLHIVSIQPIS